MDGYTQMLAFTKEKGLPQVFFLAYLTNYVMGLHLSPGHCKQRGTRWYLSASCLLENMGIWTIPAWDSSLAGGLGNCSHCFSSQEINRSMQSNRLMRYLPVGCVKYNLKTFTPLSCYLHGARSRVASSMLALLLASWCGRRLRMRRMRMQGSIRVGILLSKWASGN